MWLGVRGPGTSEMTIYVSGFLLVAQFESLLKGRAARKEKMTRNKKAGDFSPASFWLVPSPRHLAKMKSCDCRDPRLVAFKEPLAGPWLKVTWL
jgi:hypothetical protein